MIVERLKLVEALKNAMPGIETRNVILEGSDAFIFSDGFIHTYNDILSVSVPFPITNKAGDTVSGAIKAKEFYDLISKFKGDTLKIITKEKTWILKSENATAELTLLENVLLEKVKHIISNDSKWTLIPKNFIDGISICKFSSNRSNLSGIFVQKNIMCSTDELRINWINLSDEMKESFWINDVAADEVMKLNRPTKYAVTKSWVSFRTKDGVIFSCKRLDEKKYPFSQIKNMVESHEKEKGDISNLLPKELNDAINRAASLSQNIETYETVTLTFSNDGIEIFSQRACGKYLENVKWEHPFKKDIKPISISVDHSMIENGIKNGTMFYLKNISMKDDSVTTRLVFINTDGIQLVSTFAGEK